MSVNQKSITILKSETFSECQDSMLSRTGTCESLRFNVELMLSVTT